MATIKLGFSASNSLVSRIIRHCTRAEASHAFFLVEDPILGDVIVQEGWCGLQVISRTDFLSDGSRIVQVVPAKVNLDEALKKHAASLGDSYDYLGLVGMAWVVLGRWLKKKWRNPFASAKSMICSRFVTTVIQDAGWPGSEALDARSIDPGALADFAST